MASGYGKKQTFGQKVKGTLRRIFTLSVLGATFIGAPAYYEYGTMQTQEVKIKDVQSNWVRYDSSKGEAVYDYKLVTDKGLVFENKNTLLHLKFNSKDMQDQLNASRTPPDDSSSSSNSFSSFFNFNSNNGDNAAKPKDPSDDPANKVYRVSYYGTRIDVPFIHTYPNVLSIQEVSKEELQARAKAVQDARKAQAQVQKQNGQQPQAAQPNGAAAPAGNGALITFDTVVNGQDVNLTVPADALNKVKINSVTPVIPKAPGS